MPRRKPLTYDTMTRHPVCPECGCKGFCFKMNKEKKEIMYCANDKCEWFMVL